MNNSALLYVSLLHVLGFALGCIAFGYSEDDLAGLFKHIQIAVVFGSPLISIWFLAHLLGLYSCRRKEQLAAQLFLYVSSCVGQFALAAVLIARTRF